MPLGNSHPGGQEEKRLMEVAESAATDVSEG